MGLNAGHVLGSNMHFLSQISDVPTSLNGILKNDVIFNIANGKIWKKTSEADELIEEYNFIGILGGKSDWLETNPDSLSYIENKPDIIPSTLKINNKSLINDITLTADDVGSYSREEIDSKLSSAYKAKGSVSSRTALDTIPDKNVGDVYNTVETGMNYVWTGSEWDPLGTIVDLSNYFTKSEITSLITPKLDKTALSNRVYVTDGTGASTTYPHSQTASSSTFALRDGNGRVRTQAGVSDTDCVNLLQMNAAFDSKVKTESYVTQSEYDALVANGTKSSTTRYYIYETIT